MSPPPPALRWIRSSSSLPSPTARRIRTGAPPPHRLPPDPGRHAASTHRHHTASLQMSCTGEATCDGGEREEAAAVAMRSR
nr:unnamed protein product [Digitaria exilis]